ncbi:hypothetical protein BKA56DRAFT_679437 [Ilyonectria sp. MPI-CAGE-AT-0026]|nr:hypothetical protein BKA56DRAFT_679437 [Ilyonectria sp. MPI-CAGE-AT-0026]
MALDPISAVGLAAGILQFVDFTSRLVSVVHEFSETCNDSTVENCDIEAVTRSLVSLTTQLSEGNRVSQTSESVADEQIAKLGSACEGTCSELLETLEKLKGGSKKPKWKSIIQALGTVWQKEKIDSLRARLAEYRAGINTALLVSLSDRVDDITPELLGGLKAGNTLDQLKMEILKMSRHCHHSGEEGCERFSVNLGKMTAQERELHLRSQLLEDLSFRDQQEREYRIIDAHSKTFCWIFKPTTHSQRPWSNFGSWLEGDDDHLYWITGKAGSGKSTLMKFIVHENESERLLRKWSGNLPLVITKFYFWNSGSQDQMSQEGLLRKILHDALSQRPQLLPTVCPNDGSAISFTDTISALGVFRNSPRLSRR